MSAQQFLTTLSDFILIRSHLVPTPTQTPEETSLSGLVPYRVVLQSSDPFLSILDFDPGPLRLVKTDD